VNNAPLTVSVMLNRPAGSAVVNAINACAIETRFRSLSAAAADAHAARICFDIRVPRHVPVHYTGAGMAGAKAALWDDGGV